jgi:hypothetical protein
VKVESALPEVHKEALVSQGYWPMGRWRKLLTERGRFGTAWLGRLARTVKVKQSCLSAPALPQRTRSGTDLHAHLASQLACSPFFGLPIFSSRFNVPVALFLHTSQPMHSSLFPALARERIQHIRTPCPAHTAKQPNRLLWPGFDGLKEATHGTDTPLALTGPLSGPRQQAKRWGANIGRDPTAFHESLR